MATGRIAFVILTLVALSGCSTIPANDRQLAKEYASCQVFRQLTVPMPSETLYSLRSGHCAAVASPDDEYDGGWAHFSDKGCRQEVDYKPTSFLTYCMNNLLEPTNHYYIGNAAAWRNDGAAQYAGLGRNSRWTLSHGPSLNILAVSPKGNQRPFMKQVEYRDVDGCHLEMRVYKNKLEAQNLKPLLLIHGGGWKYRGFGAIGAEALVSQLTERGFIVFEPYYRLMGNADGPGECRIPAPVNGVAPGELIVADIESALDWVELHGSTLGAQQEAHISLVGQSAGAHLAGWLATHRGAEIDKVLVLYTPADMEYYVQQLGHKYPWNHQGRELVQQFLGVTDLSAIRNPIPPFVQQNSFPELIRDGVDFPPIFMIHGNADSLVPVEMSTRMCDALANRDPATPMPTKGGRYTCGTRRGVTNVLYVVNGADHMLDLKCMIDPKLVEELGKNFQELTKLCPSGSRETSENIVKPAMLEGLDWLR